MAFPLLLLALMTVTSSVFADDYIVTKECNAEITETTTYCELDDMGPRDLGYYKIEVISDLSKSYHGCQQGYYQLQANNDKAAIRVDPPCRGIFGIKPKVSGYPYEGHCGQNNINGFKIVRGYRAQDCWFPWMAYVKLDWKSGYRSSCGGSIVNDRWILTAAHCIILQSKDGRPPPFDTLFVRTGTLTKFSNYIQREVDWFVVHPSYDHIYLGNDIALLRLKYPIKWDGCHAPVCLNTDRRIDTKLTCYISGWGKLGYDDRYPKELYYAQDRLLSRQDCDKIYGSYSTDKTICGRGTSNGGQGFCSGDSGGPLVCRRESNNRFYQHGVVSIYLGNRVCSMEGLYTSVAGHYKWIISKF